MLEKIEPKPEDITWDEYFMQIAYLVAQRSKCMRRKVGAIIVKDKRILATGYNGPPKGFPHCSKVGCIREELNMASGSRHELCWGLHAEQNAIIQAAVFGVSIKGATMYITTFPCIICAKMIVNAEISEVVYSAGYPDPASQIIFEQSNVKVRKYEPKFKISFVKSNAKE